MDAPNGSWMLRRATIGKLMSDTCSRIVAAGGVEAIIGSLRANLENEQVQRLGLIALVNIIEEIPISCIQIVEAGGVEVLMATLRAYTSLGVKECISSAWLLRTCLRWDISRNPTRATVRNSIIAVAGGVEAIVEDPCCWSD